MDGAIKSREIPPSNEHRQSHRVEDDFVGVAGFAVGLYDDLMGDRSDAHD